MSIEVANESGVGIDEHSLVSVSRFALGEMGINPLAELSILLMDVEAMTELHIKWMDEPGPTDVMSFPMDELETARHPDDNSPGPALLGDVVLCPVVAAEQANTAGHSLDDELHLLTVHGILHLLGYDHVEAAEEREMFRLQNDLLDAWREQRAADKAKLRLDAVDSALLDTVGLSAPAPAAEVAAPAPVAAAPEVATAVAMTDEPGGPDSDDPAATADDPDPSAPDRSEA